MSAEQNQRGHQLEPTDHAEPQGSRPGWEAAPVPPAWHFILTQLRARPSQVGWLLPKHHRRFQGWRGCSAELALRGPASRQQAGKRENARLESPPGTLSSFKASSSVILPELKAVPCDSLSQERRYKQTGAGTKGVNTHFISKKLIGLKCATK